jgi:chemotaxis protein MotB
MARKKKAGGGGPGSGDWLNTYADMVTLLLTFFILLFSMSSLDAAKFNIMVQAFSDRGESSEKIIIRGETTGDRQDAEPMTSAEAELEEIDMEAIFAMLSQMAAEQNAQADNPESQIVVSQGNGYVFVSFPGDMLFEANSSILLPGSLDMLNFVGSGLKSVQDQTSSINIVGHTAAIPDNPDYAVSDRLLSSARANEVLIYFEDVVGVDPRKLYSIGMGKWMPTLQADGTPEDNMSEESRAKNRRVEILIQNEGASLTEQLDNVYERLIEEP